MFENESNVFKNDITLHSLFVLHLTQNISASRFLCHETRYLDDSVKVDTPPMKEC